MTKFYSVIKLLYYYIIIIIIIINNLIFKIMKEIKKQLEKCFNEDKFILLDLTFNEAYLFYDEPQNFEDYYDLIKDLSIKQLQSIVNNFTI